MEGHNAVAGMERGRGHKPRVGNDVQRRGGVVRADGAAGGGMVCCKPAVLDPKLPDGIPQDRGEH